MHVPQETVPDIEKVIDLFAVANRRLDFVWFLLVFNQYIVFGLKIIFENITCFYFSDISGLIYIIIKPILMEQGQNLSCQLKLVHLHIFASLLIMDINKCQVMVKFQSSASIQICSYYLL